MARYYLGSKICIVEGCTSVEGDKGRSHFRLPKDMDRLNLWLSNINRLDLQQMGPLYCYRNYRLCNLHFEDNMFTNVFKQRLKRNAIPKKLEQLWNFEKTIGKVVDISETNIPNYKIETDETNTDQIADTNETFDAVPKITNEVVWIPIKTEPPDPDDPAVKVEIMEPSCETHTTVEPILVNRNVNKITPKTMCDKSTQTRMNMIKHIARMDNLKSTVSKMTEQRKRLEDKIKVLEESREISRNEFLKYCKNHFNSTFFEIIKAQSQLSDDEGYSNEFKHFALELYSVSPLIYKKINKIIRLPSENTLKEMIECENNTP